MAKRDKKELTIRATAKAEVSAKAAYQRKRITTEIIPPDVTRAKASAWLDMISPITEWAGLKGDALRYRRAQLRIQQEEALEKLARSIKRKMKGEKISNPLPSKIIVPALEAASLEDPESILIEWWADLLTSSARFGLVRPYFIDIMKSMGAEEAELLEKMWIAGARVRSSSDFDSLDYRFSFDVIVRHGVERVSEISDDKFRKSDRLKKIETLNRFLDSLVEFAAEQSCALYASISLQDDREHVFSSTAISELLVNDEPRELVKPGVRRFEGYVSEAILEICTSLNLLREETASRSIVIAPYETSRLGLRGYAFTKLGAEFMSACRPGKQSSWRLVSRS